MSAGETRLLNADLRTRVERPTRLFRIDHLRRLRGTEQVAAVCYRVCRSGIEFLLVETRNGRWTFPKGSAEPGLTHAQAAALEAFEEAGVYGRMEETAFTRYLRRKRGTGVNVVVNVHLCEVLRLDPPEEEGRHPTWFPAEKAKRKLCADRSTDHGSELERVLEQAVRRIEKLQMA
jgi:8-oxo-dGTP pyrophosphatase MutT (NUDIX family)